MVRIWFSKSLLAVIVFPMVVACSSVTGAGDSESVVHVRLNEATGKIEFPYLKYFSTYEEDKLVVTATTSYISGCVIKANPGLAAEARMARARSIAGVEGLAANRLYGVWSRPMVAKYGFDDPAIASAPSGELKHSPQYEKASWKCSESDGMSKYFPHQVSREASSVRMPEPGMGTFANGDPVAKKKLYDQWRECVTKRGVNMSTADPDSWMPDVEGLTRQEQIRMALVGANCKYELGTVQKMADLDATADQPILDRNEPQLVEYRKQWLAVVADARAYMARTGG